MGDVNRVWQSLLIWVQEGAARGALGGAKGVNGGGFGSPGWRRGYGKRDNKDVRDNKDGKDAQERRNPVSGLSCP